MKNSKILLLAAFSVVITSVLCQGPPVNSIKKKINKNLTS